MPLRLYFKKKFACVPSHSAFFGLLTTSLHTKIQVHARPNMRLKQAQKHTCVLGHNSPKACIQLLFNRTHSSRHIMGPTTTPPCKSSCTVPTNTKSIPLPQKPLPRFPKPYAEQPRIVLRPWMGELYFYKIFLAHKCLVKLSFENRHFPIQNPKFGFSCFAPSLSSSMAPNTYSGQEDSLVRP